MKLSRKELDVEVKLYNEFFQGKKALEEFQEVDTKYGYLVDSTYYKVATRAAAAIHMAAAKAAKPYVEFYPYFWKREIEFWLDVKEVAKHLRALRVDYYYN